MIDSGTLPILVNITNLTLNGSAIGKTNAPGEGHFHIYLNGVWLRADVEKSTYLAGIPSGSHVLRIELAENNHTELGVGAQVNFSVAAGAPRIVILSPSSNAAWPSSSAELNVRVENFTLDPQGSPVAAGHGRYRVYLDGILRYSSSGSWLNVTGLRINATNVIRAELVDNLGAQLPSRVYDQVALTPSPGVPVIVLDQAARQVASVTSGSLRAAFTISNFTVDLAAIGQPNVAGRGHTLAYLDDVPLGPGGISPQLLTDIADGSHMLAIELVNNDNLRLGERVVDQLFFTVGGGPRINITAPTDLATVNASSVEAALSVSNLSLSAAHLGGLNVAGEGHWHVFVDGAEVGFGAGSKALVSDLSPGSHLIVVELRENDHAAFPWAVFDAVRVTVSAGSPRLTITSPAGASATVASSSVDLTILVQNFTLSSGHLGGAAVVGEGNWHLFVDEVYRGSGASTTVLAPRLLAGTHTIEVRLFNNDHSALPWPVFDRVEVTVPEGSPWLSIINPLTGTLIPLNFTGVKVLYANFTVVEKTDTTPVAGEGHWHLFLDGALATMVYSDNTTLIDLAPGVHTLRAEFVGNNHLPLAAPVADEVVVTVGGARASIRITSPATGSAIYGDTAALTVEVLNFTMAPNKVGQAAIPGEGHWHFLLDGVYVTYVLTPFYSATGLSPGNHTLTARLYNNDHSPLAYRIESVVTLVVAGAPQVRITSPSTGLVTYDASVQLTVTAANFTLDPLSLGSQNLVGHGHYHVYVDGTLAQMSSNLTLTLTSLATGAHLIRVELVNRDHTPIGTLGSSAEVIVTVQSAPPPVGDPTPVIIGVGLGGAAVGFLAGVFAGRKRRQSE